MDALCLHALVGEIQPVLQGIRIGRIAQLGRWGLALIFQGARGPRALLLSVKPGAPQLEVLSRWRDLSVSPSRFGDLLTSRLEGACIESIEQIGLDRIVAVHLKGDRMPGDGMSLYAEMLGPRGNIVLVDRPSGTVLGRLRSPSREHSDKTGSMGEPYRPPLDDDRVDPRSIGKDEFAARLGQCLDGGVDVVAALVRCFTGFGPMIAAELVARAHVVADAPFEEQVHALWRPFSDLIDRLSDGDYQPRVVLGDDGEPVGTSAFSLVTVPPDRQAACDTMTEAVHRYHEGLALVETERALRTRLRRTLRTQTARAQRLLDRLARQAGSYAQAERYARLGRLLLANRDSIRRGQSVVELPDYADSAQQLVQIELDPAKPLQDNAKRYFAMHRKAARGAEIVDRRVAEAEGRLAALRRLLDDVESATGVRALQRIETALAPLVRSVPARDRRASSRAVAEGPEPRAFRSSDGLDILVGKTGAGNDRLTWRIARPHDLWLHAQGVSGAHVVVRLNKGKTVPPRTLVEAAQIAAHYSRARREAKVPVDYALKRHLRKPRGAAPGVVLLGREKTIVVQTDPHVVRRLHPAERARVGDG
jgi:predicted ribosome quality control (RQC) complex YloA/Tae2 family protein